MSNFKITFTLKQHTPIIHFQSSQSGATIRATELKPKFDKFLKKYAFDGSIPNKFKIAEDKEAIDYKVKIIANSSKEEEIPKRDELFFGNMKPKNISDKEWEKHKKYFIENDNIKVEFLSFNTKLINIIKEYFASFLALNNFGSRQNKGYGSFYIDEKDINYIDIEKALQKIDMKYYSFNVNNWKQDLSLFYRFLRQGINLKGYNRETKFYTKPAIFLYLNNIKWEKKAIKESIINNKRINQNEYKIIRDIFGLSTLQFWMSYKKNITKEDIEKENGKPKIERFKSPITFKVINKKIYFYIDDIYKKMLGKRFKINNKIILSIIDNFDFYKFFEFVKDIKLNNIIDTKYHNTSEFKTLKKIINSLKATQ